MDFSSSGDEHRVNLHVNLAALRHNFQAIQTHAAPLKVMAVLKANAYGLGVMPVAKTLCDAGVDYFGVAEIHEALQLVFLGKPVQILSGLLPSEIPPAVAAGIICPVTDWSLANALSLEAEKQKKTVRCALAIDSGMGRAGLVANRALPEIRRIRQLPHLEVVGIYSHFSCAYDAGDSYNTQQINAFRHLIADLAAEGITFPLVHMAASDALNNIAESRQAPFTLVRCGLNLYGYYDGSVGHTMDLQPVVSLSTKLVAIRELEAGSAIGYGRMHRLKKRSRVGIAAAGYADGMPLALSNRGYLLLRGVLCPVLGRISMDYTSILVDEVPDCACGDEVVCFGRQGEHSISVDEWAHLKGTHAYEILCGIGTRVKRVYEGI